MFAGIVPAFLAGAALAYLRLWGLLRAALKFKDYDSSRKYREYHRCAAAWGRQAAACGHSPGSGRCRRRLRSCAELPADVAAGLLAVRTKLHLR